MGNNQSSSSLPIPAKGIWQWQSNNNPWSKDEPQEWTSYGTRQNELIEQAFFKKLDRIDLGNHYILFSKKLQFSKKDPSKQRRVQRVIGGQDAPNPRGEERFCGELVNSKTINDVYGELENLIKFLNYKVELCFDVSRSLDSDSVHRSALRYVEPILNGIKDEAVDPVQKKEASEFTKDFYGDMQMLMAPNERILAKILKAYTKETFLYRRINHILRNENWEEIKNLAPFIVCLAKAFTSGKFSPKFDTNNEQNIQTSQDFIPLTLYRGAWIDYASLSAYDPQKTSHFSWNGVTSTSKNRKVAEQFLSKPRDAKVSVLFIINAKVFSDATKNRNMIDISPYSVFPSEDEIILAPGTGFKIISMQQVKQKYEITLELLSEFDGLRGQGIKFVGDMQANLYDGFGHSTLSALKDDSLDEALKYISARSMHALTLTSCEFSTAKMEEILRLIVDKKLIFMKISQTIISTEIAGLFSDYLRKTNLKNFELCTAGLQLNESKFRLIIENLPSCTEELKIEGSKNDSDDEILINLGDSLSNTEVRILIISGFKINEQAMRRMCQAPLLTLEKLTFENCQFESDSLFYLFEKIPQTFIESLDLDSNVYGSLSGQYEASSEHIILDKEKCRYSLSCKNYSDQTEIGFANLCTAMKFASIQELYFKLPVNDRYQITVSIAELRNLFEGLNRIPGLEMFKFEINSYSILKETLDQVLSLLSLSTGLKGLSIDFAGEKISEEQVIKLFSILKSYSMLESLIFKRERHSISDETASTIHEFLALSQLQTFRLIIGKAIISEQAIINLLNGISSVKSLKALTLDLNDIETFTSNCSSSCCQLLNSLSGLQELCFQSSWDSESNEELTTFSHSLATLTDLKVLNLKFSDNAINIHGYESVTEALRSLTSLVSLKINIYSRNVSKFKLQNVLPHLPVLKTLELDYRWTSVSNEEVIELGRLLCSLKELTTVELGLGYGCCITRSEFEQFCNVKRWRDFKTLRIDCSFNETLSKEGIIGFCQVIKDLSVVQSIYADFYKNLEIDHLDVQDFNDVISKFSTSSPKEQMKFMMALKK